MQLHAETYKAQSSLADYCRTGNLDTIPGINRNHVHQYRRLVFNVVRETLENAFPLTAGFLPGGEWHQLVDEFFSHHSCRSAQVFRLPGEFYEYVRDNERKLTAQYPFLNDLLCVEWIEIELHLSADLILPVCKEEGDWLQDRIVINPEYRLIPLHYPVHLYPPGQAVNQPGNYFLLLFREQESGDIRFISLSVLFAYVMEQIAGQQLVLADILDSAAEIFRMQNRDLLTSSTIAFLQELMQQQFILGFNPWKDFI